MWDKIWCQLEGMWRFWAIIGIKTQNWISPRHSQDKSRHSTLNSSNSESKKMKSGPKEGPKWGWKLIISFKLKFCEKNTFILDITHEILLLQSSTMTHLIGNFM